MSDRPISLSTAPDLPFRFIAGDPALDLVNTADWTSSGEPALDRLTSYDRLTWWAEEAGLLTARLGTQFRAAGRERVRESSSALDAALELRWTLRELCITLARGERVAGHRSLRAFNRSLAAASTHLQLVPAPSQHEGSALGWGWRDATDRLDSIVWPVIRSAAELLVSDEASRVRECGGLDCGWLYVDRSRNGLRRWCEMETCGTREKSRQRALRERARRARPLGQSR